MHLKNGARIEGEIVSDEDEDPIVVKTPNGKVSLPQRLVKRVERQAGNQAPTAKKKPASSSERSRDAALNDDLAALRRAARSGRPADMVDLGIALEPKPECVKWYRKAALKGDKRGLSRVGWAYNAGIGVQANQQKAVQWYRKAADAGDTFGTSRLYAYGILAGGFAKARVYCQQAAEQGDPLGCYYLAKYLTEGWGGARDLQAASRWWRKGAELGHPACMSSFGGVLQEGKGVPKNPAAAIPWLRRSAERGWHGGMQSLGAALVFGLGVPKDAPAGVAWWQKAISTTQLGREGSMSLLARAFEVGGRGVPQDTQRALDLYREAARLANGYATYKLGDFHERGVLVGKDEAQAARHYRLAIKRGYLAAKGPLNDLLRRRPDLR